MREPTCAATFCTCRAVERKLVGILSIFFTEFHSTCHLQERLFQACLSLVLSGTPCLSLLSSTHHCNSRLNQAPHVRPLPHALHHRVTAPVTFLQLGRRKQQTRSYAHSSISHRMRARSILVEDICT